MTASSFTANLPNKPSGFHCCSLVNKCKEWWIHIRIFHWFCGFASVYIAKSKLCNIASCSSCCGPFSPFDKVSLLDRVCAWLLASWPYGKIGGWWHLCYALPSQSLTWKPESGTVEKEIPILEDLQYQDVWVRISSSFEMNWFWGIFVLGLCVCVFSFCTCNTLSLNCICTEGRCQPAILTVHVQVTCKNSASRIKVDTGQDQHTFTKTKVRQAAAEQTQRRLLSRQAVQYQGRLG